MERIQLCECKATEEPFKNYYFAKKFTGVLKGIELLGADE